LSPFQPTVGPGGRDTPEGMADRDWEARYRADDVPWDSDAPAPDLVELVGRAGLSGRAIELGCGTGVNAVWLAARGFATTAIDLSPTAIARARDRARAAGAEVAFVVGDVFDREVLPAGPVEFVFDRGVFHVMDGDARAAFVARVAELLVPGGTWLSLLGNRDQPWEGPGPPRWTAAEVVAPVEPRFEVHELVATRFGEARIGEIVAWRLVARRR